MSRRDDDNPLMNGYTRGPSWKKIMGITVCVVLGVVAAGSAGIYYFGHNLINMSNFVSDDDVQQVETLPDEAYEDATEGADAVKGVVLNESEMDAIHQQMSQMESVDTIMNEEVYNVLLAGVDRRDKTWNGNSDSMMLVSINNEKKRVSIVSLMRDTYVDIPGHGYNKLNASYAYGGGPLLCDTVEENYRVDVERYAAVDFEDMVEVIDAMGGVELTWTDAEIEVSNGYIMDLCENVLDIPYEEHLLKEAGTYNTDGVQAVCYARNRFVGNSDYTRTQRQRYVIGQMTEKLKTLSTTQLYSFVKTVLPLITHNIPEEEIWDLVSDAPQLLKYEFITDRIPYDNMYETVDIDGQGMLVPDWDDTIAQLQDTIYGSGSVSNNSDNSEDQTEADFTDEYLEMTGGTGVLFPDGYNGTAQSEEETAAAE